MVQQFIFYSFSIHFLWLNTKLIMQTFMLPFALEKNKKLTANVFQNNYMYQIK